MKDFTRLLTAELVVGLISLWPAFGFAEVIDFESAPFQWLAGNPYTEDGFRFEDVLGGTGYVTGPEFGGTGYLALGDWGDGPGRPLTSRIRVDHELGIPFTLHWLDYYLSGSESATTDFLSSRGGVRSVDIWDPPLIDFSGDPAWQSISWFTITGVEQPGTGGFNEAIVEQLEATVTPGSHEEHPHLPSGGGGGAFHFDGVPGGGGWFDPPPATGYVYETDGASNFIQVGLPTSVPDADGTYTVSDSVSGSSLVPAGGFHTFATPVDKFTITGIDPAVDGGDPLAFPTFLQFDESTVSFTMTPIPEPSTLILLTMCTLTLLAYARRRHSWR